MKLSRLYQPRNPQFWLLVILNVLSSVISYLLRSHELPPLAALALGGFALANVLLGLRIAWRLMAEDPPRHVNS